jgi:hypothetical protein
LASNGFGGISGFSQFKRIGDKNSGAFKDQPAFANPAIGSQMLTNFNTRHEFSSSLAKFISTTQSDQKLWFSEGSEAGRSAHRAADEVRVYHQSQSREADRINNSSQCFG